jgi:hypothetical protein
MGTRPPSRARVKIGNTTTGHTAPSTGRERCALNPTYGGDGVVTSRVVGGDVIERSDNTQIIQQPMLVATCSFTATYDGQAVRITAGQTRVGRDHELARRLPKAWSARGESNSI